MSFLNTFIAKTLPLVPKSIVGRVSRRYIAGSSLQDATQVVRRLNAQHLMATLDLLGEDVYSELEAVAIKDEWLRIIQSVQESKLDSNCSLKLSQLGLRIDAELCYRNLEAIVSAARRAGNFVRIDMEDSSTTSDTLAIYRRLREAGYDNVGGGIQAYLRRSEEDVRQSRVSVVELPAHWAVISNRGIQSDHPIPPVTLPNAVIIGVRAEAGRR